MTQKPKSLWDKHEYWEQARRKQFDIGPANTFSSLSFCFLPSYFLPLLSPSVVAGPLCFLPLSTLPLLSIPIITLVPSLPSLSLPFPFPLLSLALEIVALNTATGCGERCKLPAGNQIWCILALKSDIWWHQFY